MNNRQAKEVLLLYRPGTDDPAEPDLAQALELAQRDPALGRWFDEQSRFQASLRAGFHQIEPPPGLKEQILSERKIHTTPAFRRPAVLLAAAAVLICLVLGVVLWPRGPLGDSTFVAFRNRVPSIVQREYPKMDLETSDLGQIYNYLSQQGLGNYTLPKALAQTPGTGCKVLSWNDRPFSMVCFHSGRTGKPTDPDLFLFIIDRGAVRGAPSAAQPEFHQPNRRLATASWSSGDKVYVLGGFGDEAFLRRYL